MGKKFFIIWDPKDGDRPRFENDEIISDGVIGRITEENVYLTTYAKYTEDKRHTDLDVGESTVAEFSLSGSKGLYKIYRVA